MSDKYANPFFHIHSGEHPLGEGAGEAAQATAVTDRMSAKYGGIPTGVVVTKGDYQVLRIQTGAKRPRYAVYDTAIDEVKTERPKRTLQEALDILDTLHPLGGPTPHPRPMTIFNAAAREGRGN